MTDPESMASACYENEDGTDRVIVYPDQHAEDPRKWESNRTRILTAHRKYRLGDEQFQDKESIEERKKEIQDGGGHVQPVYMYDHSGITVSIKPYNDPWDSGQIGWIAIEKAKLDELEISNADADKIKEIVDAEMKTWDQFLVGEVYSFRRYQVEGCSEGHVHEVGDDEQVHGFFGDDHFGNAILEYAGIVREEDGKRVLIEGWKEVSSWSLD